MFVIRKTDPPYNSYEYLANERGYAGPVYGSDIRVAILYESKAVAKYIIKDLKRYRRHKAKRDGGYGLESWSVVEISEKEENIIKSYHRIRRDYEISQRKMQAEKLLKNTPYKIVKKEK